MNKYILILPSIILALFIQSQANWTGDFVANASTDDNLFASTLTNAASLSQASIEQDGSLDPSFSEGIGFNGDTFDIAVQADGKILVGGQFTSYNGQPANRIARLNTDGTLDTSFQTGTGFDGPLSGAVLSIALQADGKIVVGGQFTSYQGTTVNRIARLESDGSLDASFNIGTGFNNSPQSIAVQSNGKIIVGGDFTSYRGVTRNRLVRLESDGSLDTSFNIGTGFSNVNVVNVQSNGKIIVGGDFISYRGAPVNRIVRLESDGTLDTSFSVGSGFNDWVLSIALQADGKIVVGGGFTTYNGTTANRLVRLGSDGTLDTSFNIGTGFNDPPQIIAVQSNGKIVVGGGFTTYNGTTANRLVRLGSDGLLDTSFNIGTGFNDSVRSIAMQSGGKIIVGGSFISYQGVEQNYIASLENDGSVTVAGFNGDVSSIVVQADGKMLVGGGFTAYRGLPSSKIARLNVDGTLDTSFSVGSGFNDSVRSIALQEDGKIVIGGYFTSYNNQSRNRILRLHEDGSLDTSFNIGFGFNGLVRDIDLTNNGKMVVSGAFTRYATSESNRIARLNADGTLDTSFNVGTGFNNLVDKLEITSSGKIVAIGDFTNYKGAESKFIIGLHSDGNVDPSFNVGSGLNDSPRSLEVATNGQILIGGYFTSYRGSAINGLARINEDGSLDTAFNPGTGFASSGFQSPPWSLAGQLDGKVIVGGQFTSYNGQPANRIARLNTDGTLDTSFQTGSGFNNSVWSLALESESKILAGGNFTSYNGTKRNRIARLNMTLAQSAPQNSFPPSISGDLSVGKTLIASPGSWQGYPLPTFSYQWKACNSQGTNCLPLSETSSTYTLRPSDVEKRILVVVRGTNIESSSEAVSSLTAEITESPSNISPPTIEGTTVVGDTLTFSPGTWRGYPPPSFTPFWQRCNPSGENCTDIPEARSDTYTLQQEDMGSYVRLNLEATNSVGSSSASSELSTQILSAPKNTSLPIVTGSQVVGSILSVSTGAWDALPDNLQYTYFWQRCNELESCADIGGNSNTYILQPEDKDQYIRVRVQATNFLGSAEAVSEPTSAIDMAPVNDALPEISGVLKVGSTLSASTGDWSGSPSSFNYAYQWQRCSAQEECNNILDATSASYTLQRTDSGNKIRVLVTATNAVGSGLSASTASEEVTQVPENTTLPTITGNERVGAVLVTEPGSWQAFPKEITYQYSWQRCDTEQGQGCNNIPEALGLPAYTLQDTDIGKYIQVEVRASNSVGAGTALSTRTGIVGKEPRSTSPPLVSGEALVGSTLSTTPGTWSGAPAFFVYQYEWQRCQTLLGSDCEEINEAIENEYTLRPADEGAYIQVIVTAINGFGAASASSERTRQVSSAPISTQMPTISGLAKVGTELAAQPGQWRATPGNIEYKYQWQLCQLQCTDIVGATKAKYIVQASDRSKRLRVTVRATNAVGSAVAESAQTDIVADNMPPRLSRLSVPKSVRAGRILRSALTVEEADSFPVLVIAALQGQGKVVRSQPLLLAKSGRALLLIATRDTKPLPKGVYIYRVCAKDSLDNLSPCLKRKVVLK